MRKLFITLALIPFLAQPLFAQHYKEVLYLKNGGEIRGVIIEQIPNVSVKIKTQDGSLFVYPFSEVERITKEEVSRGNQRQQRTLTDSNESRGYKGFADLGGSIGVGTWGDGVVSASTSHGYQFNPYLFLGAGIAVEHHFGWGETFLPIFAESRVNFLNNSISPFMGLRAGYSVTAYGFYLNPNFGVKFDVSNNFGMNLSVGYTLQQATYYDYFWGSDRLTIGGVSLKLGFEF